MTKKRLFFIGIAGLILVFLWPLLNNFIPLIKEWTNAKHDQAFLREVFKQANFQNALILLSLMILSSAIPGVSSSIFCIFVGLLYGPLYSIYTISSGQLCLCSNEFTHKDEDFGDTYWSDASIDCLCS